jgi:hypothetical protein
MRDLVVCPEIVWTFVDDDLDSASIDVNTTLKLYCSIIYL